MAPGKKRERKRITGTALSSEVRGTASIKGLRETSGRKQARPTKEERIMKDSSKKKKYAQTARGDRGGPADRSWSLKRIHCLNTHPPKIA